MKIAFIHPSNPIEDGTGAYYSANKIIEGLIDKGHEVTVYCVDPVEDNSLTEFETENLLEKDPKFGSRTTLLNERIMEKKQEFDNFDLIYSYRLDNMLSLGKIGQEISTKIIVTLNSYGGICPTNTLMYRQKPHQKIGSLGCMRCISNKAHKDLSTKKFSGLTDISIEILRNIIRLHRIKKTSKVLDGIDRFHAVSKHVKQNYINAGYPRQKIKVIPSILDKKFLLNHQSSFKEPYELLYVGYLKQHKGADLLIPIAHKLAELTDKEFKLTIVGDGPLKSKIEGQITEYNLENQVEMKGLVPNEDLPNVYSNHDLLVNTAKWEEPWGRVYLESLSAGTPIVSSDIENAKELEGTVTAENTPEKIAEKITTIFDNQELEHLSEKGQNQVQQYLPEKTVERLNKSLEEIAGTGSEKQE